LISDIPVTIRLEIQEFLTEGNLLRIQEIVSISEMQPQLRLGSKHLLPLKGAGVGQVRNYLHLIFALSVMIFGKYLDFRKQEFSTRCQGFFSSFCYICRYRLFIIYTDAVQLLHTFPVHPTIEKISKVCLLPDSRLILLPNL